MTPVDVIAAYLADIHHDRPANPIRHQQAEDLLNELAGAGIAVVSAELLNDLTDPDECWFDHHGGCQAHGFLSLGPGERCPHAVARELLAALLERTENAGQAGLPSR